jgi:sugar phosphate isomerase/epimerase
MQRILSTYRYVKHALTPELLSHIAHADIDAVEIFCEPSHFNYRDPVAIRELAGMLDEYGLALHSLHSPTERHMTPGRDSGNPLSISDPERIRRIDAVDEVKRALEAAERIPFRYLVQHMSQGRQTADPRKFDAAFSALEILSVFAKHRGVAIALENTLGELGSPESLQKFIKETHLHDLKLCFDIGHAHVESGVEPALEIMRDRIVTTHIHDNHGEKDEHLLPYDGTIDWSAALAALNAAPGHPALVLELKEQPAGASLKGTAPSLDEVKATFDKLEEFLADLSA